MHIGEVERITSLSRKTIKLYESCGLIKPVKSKEQGVKTYTLKEVNTIKSIKFLRSLGLSLEEIKQINDEGISLESVFEYKIEEINSKQESLKKLKKICKKMKSNSKTISDININKYSRDIDSLKTNGIDIMGKSREKRKKLVLLLLRILIALFLIAIIILLVYASRKEPISIPVIAVLISFPIIFIIWIIGTIKDDIKELENSEIKKVI